MKHIHADFMMEAAKDTTKQIQYRNLKNKVPEWIDCEFYAIGFSCEYVEFRFKPTKELEFSSSLLDEELLKIWEKEDSTRNGLRKVADAACKEERDRILSKESKNVETLSNVEIDAIWLESEGTIKKLKRIATAATIKERYRILDMPLISNFIKDYKIATTKKDLHLFINQVFHDLNQKG